MQKERCVHQCRLQAICEYYWERERKGTMENWKIIKCKPKGGHHIFKGGQEERAENRENEGNCIYERKKVR